MGDILKFAPNTGTSPRFSGKGSVIRNPDILPIFLGSAWPLGAAVTSNDIMKALYRLAGGPYLQGLQQYGYSGTATVRNEMIDKQPYTVTAGTPGNQINVITSALRSYLESLVNDDKIDNVDDNHELIVLIFLDPSTQQTGKFSGANTKEEIFEFLDDNIRFQWAWVLTDSNNLDSITRTMSHELVESISDPFHNGWEQTSPAPGANAGQIGDVCDASGIVNGVAVSSYWSVVDDACIVPASGTRRFSANYTLDNPERHDGPSQRVYVDFPPLCGGGRYYSYVERTFLNRVTVNSIFEGYEQPSVEYKINGQPVSFLGGTIDVAATRDVPQLKPLSPTTPPTTETAHLITSKLSPWGPVQIEVGPDEGNTYLHLDLTIREKFDDLDKGGGSTKKSAVLYIDLVNQKIVWEPTYYLALKNCDINAHRTDGPSIVLGPPRPGDPPGLPDIVRRAMEDNSADRAHNLMHAAELLKASRPEVAQALIVLAQGVNQNTIIG